MQRSAQVFLGICFTLCLVTFSSAATYTVTKTADTSDGTCDADCSFREAVLAANASADNDTIEFAAMFDTPQTITLGGSEIMILSNGSLAINGPGAHLLTLDGNNTSRIISTSSGVVASIDGIKFTRGNGVGATNTGRAGAIYNVGGTLVVSNSIITGNSAANGGAFNNAAIGTPSVTGDLTIRNSIISDNSATGSGGSIQNFSTSTLTVENCTFIGNTSNGTTGGGAMALNGTAYITNTTVTGNKAPVGSGGGIQSNGSLLVLTNVTVSGNTSANNGGGIHRGTTNINIFLRNSIVAGNTGAPTTPDVSHSAAGSFSSLGNNVIGNTGVSVGWVASDKLNQDPLLSPLGYYGGFGMTYALLSGSPALNAGQNCVTDRSCTGNQPATSVTTDQRGAARPADTTVDIGAFESNSSYTAVPPAARLGEAYNAVISPNDTGFTYSVTGGALPSGVNLITSLFDGLGKNAVPQAVVSVSGTPGASGSFPFALTVSNTVNTAVVNYRLDVAGAAANVSVGGRVMNEAGFGRPNVIVRMTGPGGPWMVRTSSFGYYRFDNIPTGAAYNVSVGDKHNIYTPQDVMVAAPISNLDFTPVP